MFHLAVIAMWLKKKVVLNKQKVNGWEGAWV
jgi:hypothetical protein